MITSRSALAPLAPTGIEGLDDIILGGLPIDSVFLVEGDPGSGKTTLGLQFILEGVRRGDSCLYVTLSETKAEIERVAGSHGWSVAGFAIYELPNPAEALDPAAQYTLFHPSEVELGETMKTVLDEVDRVKASRVVFDSLSEMRLLARDPLRYRRQILALKQFFIARHATVLLLDDRTSDSLDMQPQSLAHGVISLERLAQGYGPERRRLRIAKLRGVPFRSGYHDYSIRTGGVVVFPRLVAADHRKEFKQEVIKSGVAELDDLLDGGLDRGTSTLLLGPAGSGKSTLATQYAVAGAERGERAAMFIFDERIGTLLARSASLGLDLTKHMYAGLISVRQVDPAELSPGELCHQIRRAVESDGARTIIIDSMNGYLQSMSEEHFLVVHMHELLTYLNQQGVTTFLVVSQQGMLGSGVTSPVDLSYLADTVLLLRFFESAGEVRQALSVVKKRSGGHERTLREFQLSRKGLRVGKPLSEFHGILTGTPTYTGKGSPLLGGSHEQAGK